jgi:hypothetical protein
MPAGFPAVVTRPKSTNKPSHPTPYRPLVRRRLASILVFVLHILKASIRGGWTRRCAEMIPPDRWLH